MGCIPEGVLSASQERDRLYLVMEYCSGGDVAKYIRKHKRIPETTARALLRQLSAGLKELWSRNLVHVRALVRALTVLHQSLAQILTVLLN